ncbi:MAG TPA: glutaminase A [Verrucomicrobiae bacterium]|jgi:glutaminase|nr:glutaminase A [Verrucomicrobiae bacterium]
MKMQHLFQRVFASVATALLGLSVGCVHVHPQGGTASYTETSTVTTVHNPPAPPAPSTQDLQSVVDGAYQSFKNDTSGKNADYIPYLASVPSELFAVVIVTVDGQVFAAGDTNYSFSIQSCSKVFTMAQVMQESGEDAVLNKIGVEPTGMPFNSITALGLHENQAVNPLVNAGAIASVSMVQATSAEDRWQKILNNQSRFAGEPLQLINDVYQSEAATNFRNRGIAEILFNGQHLFSDPLEACDVYTRQCSIGVNARQLAVMGATLANGGVNPITQERCLDAKYVPRVLAVMTMAGFYDESGQWAYTAGLPAKTGVGGGIVAVVPGKMAIVGFSPRLNEAGNSIRATKAINFIDDQLNLNLFGSVR